MPGDPFRASRQSRHRSSGSAAAVVRVAVRARRRSARTTCPPISRSVHASGARRPPGGRAIRASSAIDDGDDPAKRPSHRPRTLARIARGPRSIQGSSASSAAATPGMTIAPTTSHSRENISAAGTGRGSTTPAAARSWRPTGRPAPRAPARRCQANDQQRDEHRRRRRSRRARPGTDRKVAEAPGRGRTGPGDPVPPHQDQMQATSATSAAGRKMTCDGVPARERQRADRRAAAAAGRRRARRRPA